MKVQPSATNESPHLTRSFQRARRPRYRSDRWRPLSRSLAANPLIREPPNMRVQRTRALASLGRSPLTRLLLGVRESHVR